MCRISDLRATRKPVELGRFDRLHDDGKRLIRGWLERAARGQREEPDFASFIYLWIAFNGWAACVTGKDGDRAWQDALIADPELNDRFDDLVGGVSPAATAARQFAELWPVFRVSDLRARGIDYLAGGNASRAEMTQDYLDAGATKFEPQCFLDHEEVPLDWGHTLAALYRVRCNLFHGEKARSSESDRLIVARAHGILLSFVEGTNLARR
jgi:hypothetical protein